MELNIILVVFANKEVGYRQERLFLILPFSSTRGTQWSFMGKINIGEWARWVLFQGTPASLHCLCILGVEGGRGGSSRERAGVVLQLFISVHGSCHLASALLASRKQRLCPPYTGHPRCEQPPARLGLSSLWCLGTAPGSPGPPGSSADQRQQHRMPLSRRTLLGPGQRLVDPAVMAIPSALQFTRHCYLYSTVMPRLKSLTVG